MGDNKDSTGLILLGILIGVIAFALLSRRTQTLSTQPTNQQYQQQTAQYNWQPMDIPRVDDIKPQIEQQTLPRQEAIQTITSHTTIDPSLLTQKNKIYRAYLATSAGSTDMKVDGSATNVEFYVSASSTADRYITQLSFIIADSGATLSKFGNIAALTNGCKLTYKRLGETITIHNALKSNWDFIRLSLGNPAFGQQTNAFIASNVSGTSEGVIPILDFTKIMPPYGIKLDKGTIQRLILTVRDDCTGVDQFDCIAYGFDRFE